MVRPRHIAVVSALALGPWGCTALVQFVDVDAGCVGASCLDAAGGDARGDALVDAGPPFDAAGVCRRKDGGFVSSGYYCGYSTLLAVNTPSPDTLVYCDAGGGALLVPCDAGCVTFPPGLPDSCNTCGGRSGRFCGVELGVPGTEGRRYLIECSANKMSPLGLCDAGCTSGDGASACK